MNDSASSATAFDVHTQLAMSEQLRQLSTLNTFDELLTAVARMASAWFDVEQVIIGRKSGDQIKISRRWQHEQWHPYTLSFRAGEEIAGWVLLYRAPYLSPDVALDPQISAEIARQLNCKTVLAVPIQIGNQFFGVLELHNRRDGQPFDQANINQATQLAEQTAYALKSQDLTAKAQQRANALETLLAFGADLNTQLNVDTVITKLTDYAVELLNTRHGIGGLYNEGTPVVIASKPHELLPLGSRIAQWVAQQKQPYMSADYRRDPFRVEDVDADYLLAMPLLIEQGVLGWLELFDKRDGTPFSWDDVALMQSLANIASVALRNSALFGKLDKQQQQLRRLSADLVTRHELERQRLARELHDEAGQSLVGIKLELSVLEQRIATTQPELRESVRQARQQVNAAASRLSAVSHGLRPPTLDELGLHPALENLIAKVEQQSGLAIALDILLPTGKLAPDVAITCYRLTQEALTNVVRHAEATTVAITLHYADHQLHLKVADDGVGFQEIRPNALGILGMRERITMLNGDFLIETGDSGTIVTALIPCPQITPIFSSSSAQSA